ncbi:MAG: hypothetical protein Hals2KO_19050 [Halioglobus sp.]
MRSKCGHPDMVVYLACGKLIVDKQAYTLLVCSLKIKCHIARRPRSVVAANATGARM